MFKPTHLLISRRQKTPVQLVAGPNGYRIYTEQEWLQKREPAFEMNTQTGLFCKGIPVVGYELEPILADDTPAASQPAAAVDAE